MVDGKRRLRVAVLTTSYPRHRGDLVGSFVAGAVDHLRAEGIQVTVVSPRSFRHFGIAYGDGIANNLRAQPWRLLLLPFFLLSFARASRRASRDADVVHAHWLPSGLAGMATGKPLLIQLWGTDVALAKRLPWLFRPVLRSARIVVCAANALAVDARSLGARDVRVIPAGIDIPAAEPPGPDEPPHILYVGRLSEEKGVADLARATDGLPLVVVGDGPLRHLLPQALGFVPHDEIGQYYERSSIVVVPSRREGYGVAAREAMAHGRAVVATAVGGLPDAIEDGSTGVLVPPRDPAALRAALERLLADRVLRDRLGAAARRRAAEQFGWEASTTATIQALRDAAR